jgi:hypothetical protein
VGALSRQLKKKGANQRSVHHGHLKGSAGVRFAG